ncbi:glutaminase liver isoform, mitochondrial-like isoform X2 [Bolinopsis microptera]|uniref:glutaminase liver isoform, mitochondrial-like isoform X2 n=1 Tax=Bolinopsis microptera TaxID=2820187 RepID=UPI00307AD7FA
MTDTKKGDVKLEEVKKSPSKETLQKEGVKKSKSKDAVAKKDKGKSPEKPVKPEITVNKPSIVVNTPSIVVNTPSTKPKEKRSTNGIKLSGTADDTDYESKIMKWDTSPDPVNPSKKALPTVMVETVEHVTPQAAGSNGNLEYSKKRETSPMADKIKSDLKNTDLGKVNQPSSKSGSSTPNSKGSSILDQLAAMSNTDDKKTLSPSLLRLYIDEMDQNGQVCIRDFLRHLKRTGLQPFRDPRLTDLMNNLSNDPSGVLTINSEIGCKKYMDVESFIEATSPVAYILNKALSSNLIIPEFSDFCKEIAAIYKTLLPIKGGLNAQYIPQLARVNPDFLGISICTVDGQRFNIGDTDIPFCIQSCSKALNYAICVAELGPKKVHQHLGKEPSGIGFNQISLDKNGLPHNPMINPGAISCCSVLKNGMSLDDRFDFAIGEYKKMAGNEFVGFSNATFLSEKSCADQNFAIGYFLKEHGVFPPGTELKQTLDLYFQLCSVEATAESAAVIAATLANGGVCPTTQASCITPDAVRNTLSLMYSCGLYDYSGEWAFEVGLPGKSGVAGSIFIVVPNLMGICVWSPPLDSLGNSYRGIQFAKMLCQRFSFHQYDCISGGASNKIDPRRYQTSETKESQIVNMLFAASASDSVLLQKYLQTGVDFNMPDYDGRTALHLAVCGGNMAVVRFLVDKAKCNVNPLDRWNSTPLDDGYKYEQDEIIRFLEKKGGVKGEVLIKAASEQY